MSFTAPTPFRAAVEKLAGQQALPTGLSSAELRALDAACVVMKSGAVLSVVCYPGHPQGGEEAASVERWMNKRAADAWRLAKYAMVGTKAPAPFLMIARKP